MINYIALVTALALEAVAAYYSIIGLTTIFVSAFVPIAIMGSVLEVAKVVAVSWVYRNWDTAPRLIKYYLISAIVVLMLITSMGTFGYLSKAHMDQGVLTGDSNTKLSIIDEKIKAGKDNIDANRKTLKQMDEGVDQIMARSSDEKGAEKASALRRSQSKERAYLVSSIEAEQKRIGQLTEERAPIAAEVRKVEAEVGPIKYIAELMYDNASDDILNKAVRWVIILIVSVFDPLAVVMLLAANQGLSKKEITEDYFTTEPVVKRGWIDKAADLIQKRKSGILEIDENSIVNMK